MPILKLAKPLLTAALFLNLLAPKAAFAQNPDVTLTLEIDSTLTDIVGYYQVALKKEIHRQASDPLNKRDYIHIPEIGFLEDKSSLQLDLISQDTWNPKPVADFLWDIKVKLKTKLIVMHTTGELADYEKTFEDQQVQLQKLEKENGADYTKWDMHSRRLLLDSFEKTMLTYWCTIFVDKAKHNKSLRSLYNILLGFTAVAAITLTTSHPVPTEFFFSIALFAIGSETIKSHLYKLKRIYRTDVVGMKLVLPSSGSRQEERSIASKLADEILDPKPYHSQGNSCRNSFNFNKILQR